MDSKLSDYFSELGTKGGSQKTAKKRRAGRQNLKKARKALAESRKRKAAA